MKKMRSRSALVLFLIIFTLAGLTFFGVQLYLHGGEWAASRVNGNLYKNGRLTRGRVTDRDGVLLLELTEAGPVYAPEAGVREAAAHVTGDGAGNVQNGAATLYRDMLAGYDRVEGLYDPAGERGTVTLSLSSRLNEAALAALRGKSGTVGVVNYKTGEILCMVSSPAFDPAAEGGVPDGAYINKLLNASFTPGSVFKLVTLAAAIDTLPDLYEREFHCDGSLIIGGGQVSCPAVHGNMKIEDALAKSCNCVFAELACELGGEKMAEYAKKLGITESFFIDGAAVTAGRYDIAAANTPSLAWSGVGQGTDLVTPAALLRYVAAVANGGAARDFTLISGAETGETRLLSEDTAGKIGRMMEYNVYLTYGRENFPGLELAAKSGTAELGGGAQPHAWFTGYIKHEKLPLAFVVLVENGGSGARVAGEIAREILELAISLYG